jgi:group I intron endonuclease
MIDYTKPHIYRRQIKTTGKYYIGKHRGTNKYYRGGGTEYRKDLKKYVKNFNKDVITEILEYVNDISKLDEREKWWLQSVDAMGNPMYYNLTNKSYGLNRSRTYKEKKSIGDKNRKHRLGKKLSNEHKLKISNGKKGTKLPGTSKKLKGRISPNKGKIKSQEAKQKISLANTGKLRPVTSVKHKGRISPNKGKKWSQEKKDKAKGKKQTTEHIKKRSQARYKPILQYDMQGNFIKEWESGTEIKNKLNIANSGVISCCKGKYTNAGGFIWKYKN